MFDFDKIKNDTLSLNAQLDKALTTALSLQEEQIDFEQVFISKIEEAIQSEVNRLNTAKGISLENKISCKLYGETPGYTYQQECINLWNWQVSVYEAMRAWKDTLTAIPTEDEFLTELSKYAYTVVYPEETV